MNLYSEQTPAFPIPALRARLSREENRQKIDEKIQYGKTPYGPSVRDAKHRVSPTAHRFTTNERMLRDHHRLVRSIAKRVFRRYGTHLEFQDVLGWGYEGLLEAARRFDETKGAQFSTYAYYRIQGAMIDGIRTHSGLPRRLYRALRDDSHNTQQTGTWANTHAPTQNPPLQDVGIADRPKPSLHEILVRLGTAYTLQTQAAESSAQAGSPRLQTEIDQQVAQMRAHLAQLPTKERFVLEQFYLQGRGLESIGQDLNLSKSWTSRLHTRALQKLRKRLKPRP